MTNQEIAEALFLSINTVKTHLRSVYRKARRHHQAPGHLHRLPPRPPLTSGLHPDRRPGADRDLQLRRRLATQLMRCHLIGRRSEPPGSLVLVSGVLGGGDFAGWGNVKYGGAIMRRFVLILSSRSGT